MGDVIGRSGYAASEDLSSDDIDNRQQSENEYRHDGSQIFDSVQYLCGFTGQCGPPGILKQKKEVLFMVQEPLRFTLS